MDRRVCDTDILSEIIKAVDLRVTARASEYLRAHSILTFTSVTAMGILYGLHRKGALVQVREAERLFGRHEEMMPLRDDYRLASEIGGRLDRIGRPIGRLDPLIAACALNRGLTLATGNTRHFTFVQDAGFPLRLEDWRQP